MLKCHFVPGETGKHELIVSCDNHILDGCPILVNVKADTCKIQLLVSEKLMPVNENFEICVRKGSNICFPIKKFSLKKF
jgi:hypothetical protein